MDHLHQISHRVIKCSKYADGFYNSVINDKDGHIPLPLIMFTCTALRYALLEWQKNKGVYPKASKSKFKADRPDRSNYFNYRKDVGKNASCCAATGHKLVTSPGIAHMYTFVMNTSNTLPESYQQRVHKHTLETVKRHISNNPSFRLKHPGVPDGSDGSGGTLYPLTENQTRPIAQVTGRVPYLPCGGYYTMPHILATHRVVYYARRSGVRLPLLCIQNVVTYTHHQNDTYVTLFAGVAVMQ